MDTNIKILIGILLDLYIAFGGVTTFNMDTPNLLAGQDFPSLNVWLS